MFEHANPETVLSERYEITESIEPGKYGAAIFQAYGLERATGIAVFMKAKAHDESGRTQLRTHNEVNHLSNLYHMNIPRVVEAGPDSYYPYVVTTCLPGNLEPYEWLEHNANHPMAAELCLSALKVLQYVHEHGLVHRDIKGANMTMQWSGRVSLLDFELALDSEQRRLRRGASSGDSPPENTSITSDGKYIGTVTHISPEQLAGEEATERSDLYAMGVTLYSLAHGRLPFGSQTKEVLQRRAIGIEKINHQPADGRKIPKQLRLIIERATEDDPAARYPSAADMAEDLERYLRR